ncbi:MAG: methyltransferase domain-containing protein [Bacteroidales bacterium]
MNKTKLQYLASSLKKRLYHQGYQCPSCGEKSSHIVETKYWITELRRCSKCFLLFRTPTTSEKENFQFYQKTYRQGFVTECPSENQLNQLLETKFANTVKDFSIYIQILEALGASPGKRLLDYGCSWGYGAWQFQQAGYEVTAFEVSQPRCLYARDKLGIDATFNVSDIKGSFDIIFSNHVVEHLPSVHQYLEFAINHLRPGGFLMTITPNGSEEFRNLNPNAYSKLWGFYHPQFLDDKYYLNYFGHSNLLLTSKMSAMSLFKNWDQQSFFLGNLSSSNLLCIWKKT